MEPRITVLGSSNTDMVIQLERLPKPGETILGGNFTTAAGGKGANQAVAAARAGGAVTFVSRVGDDDFGRKAVAGFRADGINVSFIVRDTKAPSGVALIFVGGNGENSIAVASGANGRLSASQVTQSRNAIVNSRILLLQLETPLPSVERAVELARKADVKVILNPAPARQLPPGLLKHVSVITPNETEAELVTGIKLRSERDIAKAAASLNRAGVENVVITLGPKGAFISSPSGQEHIKGFHVEAIDTTAAGDVFNGCLAVALAEGRALSNAVRFACAAAAISVTRLGAQPSAPSRREIERFLRL